jgi:hypothetical protein
MVRKSGEREAFRSDPRLAASARYQPRLPAGQKDRGTLAGPQSDPFGTFELGALSHLYLWLGELILLTGSSVSRQSTSGTRPGDYNRG